jgi:hypothetical protein
MPRVSVITAVTRPELLGALHESLRQQDVELEWLLQLDAQAIPADITDLPASSEKWVHVERNPKPLGSGTSRNLALMRSTGDLIIGVDDDDLLFAGALPRLVEALEMAPDCFCAWGRTATFDDDPSAHAPFKGWEREGRIPAGTIGRLFEEQGNFRMHVGSALWHRAHLIAVGGYAALVRSVDTHPFVACESLFPSYYVDAPVYLYRRHAGQMTKDRAYDEAKARHHKFNFERMNALQALVEPRKR